MKANNILGLLVFIAFWFFLTQFHLVKPIFLPPITEVITALSNAIFSAEGLKNIAATVIRAVIGFFIGTAIAVPLGILFGMLKTLYESLELLIDFFKSIPATALFPLFLIFFGFGDAAKIAMGAWASFFIVLVNTMHGVWNAKENRRIMAQTKRATVLQIISKITFFEALPFIFAGLRIAFSWTLIVIVVSEMLLGTKFGLGRMIYNSGIIFDTPAVIAGIIIIGSIGYLLNNAIMAIEKKIIHWKT